MIKITEFSLHNAIGFAKGAHFGQVDKGGKPYIEHPLRVMAAVKEYDEEIQAIAVLHDVIEDCDVTADVLRELGMTERVIDGVLALTKCNGEPYDMFIHRCAENADARLVKMADIHDNSNVTRLPEITDKDIKRLRKYHEAYKYLVNYQG